MPKLYASADGRIIAYLRTDDEERLYPNPPPGTVSALAFDAETNAALAADLGRSTDAYRLNGSTLTKGGAAQVIQADGENAQVRALAVQAVGDLTAYIGLANPSAAQRLALERLVARMLRYLIRREFGL